MDTTEKYIKMCERADDIEKSHDFLKAGGILGIHINGEGSWYFGKKIAYNAMENIWLPRQDQLQEMVIKEGGGTCIALIGVSHLMAERLNHYIFDSFEQLWLAYLMYNRYQKQWDAEKEEWTTE